MHSAVHHATILFGAVGSTHIELEQKFFGDNAMMKVNWTCSVMWAALIVSAACTAVAQDTPVEGQQDSKTGKSTQTQTVELAGGTMKLQAPAAWNVVEPKFNMIEAEFSIEKAGKDEADGRLTIMSAGGSIEGNIDRWKSQFSKADGGAAEDARVEEIEVAGLKTHMVDLSGSYADRPGGPTAPPIIRDNYRMLAAIIETHGSGTYFIKFYGGAETVEANAKAFEAFVKSLAVVD
jgi:hypothetical protein